MAFPNTDSIFHNVFSLSSANRFDLGLYRNGESKTRVFDREGVVPVYCNIHPNMVAYVRVVDSELLALVGSDGMAELTKVPTGSSARASVARACGGVDGRGEGDGARRHSALRGARRVRVARGPAQEQVRQGLPAPG